MNTALPTNLRSFIWHFLRPYKLPVYIYIFLAVAAGFWGPFNSILIKHMVNILPSIQGGDVAVLILPASLIIVNFIVFDNFTWRGITYIRCKFMPVIINRIIGESVDYVLGKSPQFYQDNLSGKIAKQIYTLADGIEKLASTIAANFLRGASLLLAAIVTAYFVPLF